MATPLANLREIRLQKLGEIRKLGIDPYPARCLRKQKTVEALEMTGKEVSVAGRIMAVRGHGGIQFMDLRDESGKIQLVFKKEKVSVTSHKLLALLDIGDFIDVQGEVFKTQAGEVSVLVANFHLLAKSLRPLPSTWYGLRDIEERYRKRYLDLIMNSQVKKVFETRSRIIDEHRRFLINRGYFEVETPVLQLLYGGGLARPFKTYHNALGIPLYMRISTELYLKRLIVGGFEKVFEVNKVFRNEGLDRQHNPEFTLLETMEAYIDYKENMKLVEEMTRHVVKEVTSGTKVIFQGQEIDFKVPWKRVTMVEAVKEVTGIDFSGIKSLEEAKKVANNLGIGLDKYSGSAIGLILAAVFEEKAEKSFIQPTFVYDYPVETAPLAKKCPSNPRYVERFEHYVAGIESSNNYSELNDPLELAARFKDERKKERLGNEEAHQTDEEFIEAIEYGMPPTSGIGPSMDRLTMILTDSPSIADVILFPTLRPESKVAGASEKSENSTKKLKLENVFYIDREVKRKFPGMKTGVAIIENVEIHKADKKLEELKKEMLNQVSKLIMEQVDDLSTIKAYRNLFKAFGVDWHSRHPSPDALLRRVVQGKGLYNVNTLVDAYNLAVLETKIGLGALDLDQMNLPVVLRFAKEGEEVLLLGETEATKIREGELVYADQERIITLDLNYRDSDYTKVTNSTKNIVLFADGCPDITSEEVMAGLEKGIEYITRFCGGKLVKKFIVE